MELSSILMDHLMVISTCLPLYNVILIALIGGQQIRVGFRKSGDSEYGTPTYVNINNYIDGATSVGNVWRRVYVPFSAMNIGAGDSLMGVTIQAVSAREF
jgi:hypothetical protein